MMWRIRPANLGDVPGVQVFLPKLNEIHPAVSPEGNLAEKSSLPLRFVFSGE